MNNKHYVTIAELAKMDNYPFSRHALYKLFRENKEFRDRCVYKLNGTKMLIELNEFNKYLEEKGKNSHEQG